MENAFLQAMAQALPADGTGALRRIIVAVSGGLDSMCLLHLCHRHAQILNIVPIVAHLDHGIRADAARQDATFVNEISVAWELVCVSHAVDTPGFAQNRKLSLENAARMLRYDFLGRCAREQRAHAVLVAHHADDQAETVLLRLLRGTGMTGLAGMRPIAPLPGSDDVQLFRPLLGVSRAELEDYANQNHIRHVLDETNEDRAHLRNRIRKELLPMIETISPGIRKVLGNVAEVMAGDTAILDEVVTARLEEIRVHAGDGFCLDRVAWRALAPHWQRAILRVCAAKTVGLHDLRFAAIEEARHVLGSEVAHATIDLTAHLRIEAKRNVFWIVHGDKITGSPTQ